MDSSERGALMLVRFIAVALIGWAVADVALYWVVCQHNQQAVQIVRVIVKSLPLIVGGVALIKARTIAEWVSDKLDL
jgi:cytochrome c oxidase assembly protein Cox11